MLSTAINLPMLKRAAKVAITLVGLSASLGFAPSASATIVQFQTVMGDFQVNLYDKTTPKTVENFLTYVKSGAYTNSIMHRAIPGFVIQGGGFKYETKLPLLNVTQNAAVINEPVYANKRGTIAMAKLNGDPNSATNQWFFSLADNSSVLDSQNGGFTVFGEVTGNGMAIIDAVAALNIFNFGSSTAFTNLPLRSYTSTDATNGVTVTDKNFVMILGIVVLDANVDSATAAGLNPVKSTYTASSSSSSSSNGDVNYSNGGGGSTGLLTLLMLIGFAVIGRSRHQ